MWVQISSRCSVNQLIHWILARLYSVGPVNSLKIKRKHSTIKDTFCYTECNANSANSICRKPCKKGERRGKAFYYQEMLANKKLFTTLGTCIGTHNWSVEEKIRVWWMRWCTIVPNSYQTRTQHAHPSLEKCRIYTNQDHQLQEIVIMLFEYLITFEYGGRF